MAGDATARETVTAAMWRWLALQRRERPLQRLNGDGWRCNGARDRYSGDVAMVGDATARETVTAAMWRRTKTVFREKTVVFAFRFGSTKSASVCALSLLCGRRRDAAKRRTACLCAAE